VQKREPDNGARQRPHAPVGQCARQPLVRLLRTRAYVAGRGPGGT
jgi:hypothetical protein